MARTWCALALFLGAYSSFSCAAPYGVSNTTSNAATGSYGTAGSSSPALSASTPVSSSISSSLRSSILSNFAENSTTFVLPSTGLTTTTLDSLTILSSSDSSLTSTTSIFSSLSTSIFSNSSAGGVSSTGTTTSTSPSSASASASSSSSGIVSSATTATESNSTAIGTGISTSSFSSSSDSVTEITTLVSSGSTSEVSTITSTLSSTDTTTSTSSHGQTSTATGTAVVTNGQCKGDDCDNGSCTGILCVSLGCSGSGCSSGLCTGLDCISLGCIGAGCSNGVCTGASCVTSGCEGSDCDSINGVCSGPNCISVGCSGVDCDSSTGACSGPDCSTETCSGSDCDKGSCTDSGCNDEGTQTGGSTNAPTDNPTSPTSNPTSSPTSSTDTSSSSSCSTQTATLCAAACPVTAIPDPSNSTTSLITSCYSTACSVTAGCDVEGTTTSSFITTSTSSGGACMTVTPLSQLTESGPVVSTTYTATAIVYTITTVSINATSSSSMSGTGSISSETTASSLFNSSSVGVITSISGSPTSTNSSSMVTSMSASLIDCTYQGADPDEGTGGYCICSGYTYSQATGTSGEMCAYTALPTSTAVITASPLYTTTNDCNVCTVFGNSHEDCTQLSDCTPTTTTSVAAASTTSSAPLQTCTLWTDCPACPEGESQSCTGTGGPMYCVCWTDESRKARRSLAGADDLAGSFQPLSIDDSEISAFDNSTLVPRADAEGDALSCPIEPLAEDSYCTASSLSKRANDVKEITLPWISNMKFSNYPACPSTGTKGITSVPKFYYPAGAGRAQNQIQGFDPAVAQGQSNGGFISGIAQSEFANDHIFEAQLISGFLSWLCGSPSITTYTQMPWPAGWTQPDSTWCEDVFGSDTDANSGYLFAAYASDQRHNNLLGNFAEVTGGVNQLSLMAVYYGRANGWKGKITKASWPRFSISNTLSAAQKQEAAAIIARDAANTFSYLADATIQNGWTTASKSVEQVCVQFDNSFWSSTAAGSAQGTALAFPAAPQGVTSWGLRALWAYWIDNHLYKIEQQVPAFVTLARTKVGGAQSPFTLAYMQPGGLVTADQMHFPHDPNNANAPIPGTQGSATSSASRFMMWDGSAHGPLGL